MLRDLTFIIAAGLLLFGCFERASLTECRAEEIGDPALSFVNKVWRVRESSSVAPGMLYIFLSEGTLVMASPHGKPALGTWKYEGGTFTMVEEGISHKVDVLKLSRDEFKIRSNNPGEPAEITLVPADSPTTDAGVVRGSVAYRERMALPPDAVVEVKLYDVSTQDVAAQVIAEVTVLPEGRQVPLPFELRYDPKKIQPDRSYALRATIRSAGRMMFTTDTVYRVITQGNPTHADLWLMRVGDGADNASQSAVTAARGA